MQAQGVDEFVGLPLWLNQKAAESFMTFSIERALAAGLRFRPLSQTVLDIYDWARANPDAPKQPDLPAALEATLLDACNP